MKQKSIILILVAILLLMTTSIAFAGAKNAWFAEWTWQGEKSGYFLVTNSDLVHLWSYDRPTGPDMHFIMKPVDKFDTTGCDDGAVWENATWTPQGIYNCLHSGYHAGYMQLFPDLSRVYYGCGYPIE